MNDSRDIDDLQPLAAAKCRVMLKACAVAGIDVLITATHRSLEESGRLYAQGRTAPGKIVTKAKPGQSFHNWRVAWDCYPRINGQVQWAYEGVAKPLWDKMGEIAERNGIEWGHNWKSIKDTPHFQYTGGHTLPFFQQGGKL